jgi:hypothetical protein
MSWSKNIMMLAVVGILSLSVQSSFAIPSLEISTSKHVYEYGDLLAITFHVSKLEGDQITLHIVDSSGKTSAPIDLPISKLNSTITSPFPFYKTTFSPGTYHINAEYSGSNATISFDLIDSGRISIPVEFKTLIKTGQPGPSPDKEYAGLIRELLNNGIISVSNYSNPTNQIHIPQWFKNNVKLWSDDSISDNEFGLAIQYLIQKRVILV